MLRTLTGAVLGATLLSGCSGGGTGPLSFGSYGNVLEPRPGPAWFGVSVCAEDGPVRVRVVEVTGAEVRGGRPVEFRLAWPDDRPFLRVISSHEPVPAAYRPAEGATGRIGRCSAPRQYGTLAVLFPPTGDEPTVVDGVRFVYEVDGDRYETVADVFLARCPEGTRSGGGERRPCRPGERRR